MHTAEYSRTADVGHGIEVESHRVHAAEVQAAAVFEHSSRIEVQGHGVRAPSKTQERSSYVVGL